MWKKSVVNNVDAGLGTKSSRDSMNRSEVTLRYDFPYVDTPVAAGFDVLNGVRVICKRRSEGITANSLKEFPTLLTPLADRQTNHRGR